MPRTRSRSQRPPKSTKTPAIIDIDLDDEDDVVVSNETPLSREAAAKARAIAAKERELLKAKREIKAEIKHELVEVYDKHQAKEKKSKTSKVKKEKRDDDDRDDKAQAKERANKDRKNKKEKKERRKQRSQSSSSSSSSSSDSDGDPYLKFKPYTKVTLVNLVRKADLNGKVGQVVHPSCAVSPCPPGCMIVRLESGREIAVRPQNLRGEKSFHMGVQQSTLQELRLKQVLASIRLNLDNVSERDASSNRSCSVLGDGEGVVQGGIGHVL